MINPFYREYRDCLEYGDWGWTEAMPELPYHKIYYRPDFSHESEWVASIYRHPQGHYSYVAGVHPHGYNSARLRFFWETYRGVWEDMELWVVRALRERDSRQTPLPS